MAKRINQAVGLPTRVDAGNPRDLQRAIDAIMQFLRTANGEGDATKRYATVEELDALRARLDR
jgi:hypothetical protein